MDCLNVAKILPNSPRKTRGQIQVSDCCFIYVQFLEQPKHNVTVITQLYI